MSNSYSSPYIIKKVSMFILALMPILAWYKIPFPISLGHTIVLFLSVYVIVRNGFRINVVPSIFWAVLLYVCFMWMHNHEFEFWTILPPGGWIFFIFVLALIWGVVTFDVTLLKKYMRWVVLLSGVLFWIQYVLFLATGSPQFCFVPNITGAFIYEGFSYGEIVAKHLNGGLPCSIFLEKSYLAYYFLTYLTLIWYVTDNMFTKEILFVIATLTASRSGTAMVGLIILFVVKMFSVYWNANTGRRVMLVILLVPLIIGTSYLYLSSDMGQQLLSRTEEFSNEGSSGFTRVVNGYLLFNELTFQEKIIGIPDATDRFAYEKADGRSVFYVNGVQTILLSLGYIGAFLYLLFYSHLYRKTNLVSKLCIIVLLIMSLLESNYLNPYMLLLTIIPCSNFYWSRKCNII